jgi:hypothetical protein
MTDELKRETALLPAYDNRDEGGGQHGVELYFKLTGPEGMVYVYFTTDWYLTPSRAFDERPEPGGLGWHTWQPQDDRAPSTAECDTFGGRPCWIGESGLGAEPYRDVLLSEGSDGVWAKLEAYYAERFLKDEVTP